jgi:hypothetical protein
VESGGSPTRRDDVPRYVKVARKKILARRKIFLYIEVGFKIFGDQEHALAHVFKVVHILEVIDHAEVVNVVALAQISCPVALTDR